MFIKDLEEQRKEIENRNVNVVNEEVFDLNRLIDKYAGLSLLSTSSMLKSTLFDKISGKIFYPLFSVTRWTKHTLSQLVLK